MFRCFDKNKCAILFPLLLLTKNNAIAAALSYALTISLANALGPERFGRYSLALIIGSVLSVFISFGTDQTAPVIYSKHGDRLALLGQVLGVRILFLGVCFLGIGLYAIADPPLCFFIVCLILANLNLGFFYESTQRNQRYSYIYLAERVVYVVIVFSLILFDAVNMTAVFSMLLMATVLSLVFQYVDHWTDIKQVLWRRQEVLRDTILMNMPLVVISLAVFSYGGFSRIILENKLGQELLGIYSAGWQLITIGTLLQSQVTRVWRLKISIAVNHHDARGLKDLVKSYLIFATGPVLLLSGIMFLASETIVGALFAPSYSQLAEVVPVFGIYIFVINLAGLTEMLWVATVRNIYYMLINVFFGFLLLGVLNFIPVRVGIFGFATATVATHMIATVILFAVWYAIFSRASKAQPIYAQSYAEESN